MQQNHTRTLRLKKEMDDYMSNFAKRWNVSTSYVYRAAIVEFIKAKRNQQAF